jgi:hypothetical protein
MVLYQPQLIGYNLQMYSTLFTAADNWLHAVVELSAG